MKKATMHFDKYLAVGQVDKRIFGSFVEHLGRCVYEGIYQPGQETADEAGIRKDVLKLIRDLEVPIVRYPGGNFVSGFHWEDSVGPKELRPRRIDPAWMVIETNEFGLHEFMDWTKKANTEPMMAVNLGTRGIEDAKNLVEYCNVPGGSYYSDLRKKNGAEDPFHIKLWCLGNEMDGPWQMGHKTAEEYGRLAAETGRMMKWVDPSIELVACGSSFSSIPTFASWESTVLDLSYDTTDYISMHQYYNNFEDNTADFLASNNDMDRFIRQVISTCDYVKAKKKSKKSINISFDEWNVWYHSSEQDKKIPKWSVHPHQLEDVYNFEDLLLVGSMLITLLNHSDRVKIACLAQLVNVIAPIMTSDKSAWKQTIYYPYLYASTLGRGTVLLNRTEIETYESKYGDAPYVDNTIVMNEEARTLTIFAVNKHFTEDIEFTADLRQFEGITPGQHIELHHEDFKIANTEENPDAVKPSFKQDITVEGGKLSVPLKHKSFNVITLNY